MGKQREARQMLSGLKAEAFDIAAAYAALGDKDEAFRILEKAFEERTRCLCTLRRTPALTTCIPIRVGKCCFVA